MDDPQRKPGDGDRDALVARIRSAAEQGRISTADRDIRLANVASAQSMAELDLMSRDLDQLEATLPSAPAALPADSGPAAPELADELADKAVDVAKGAARSFGVVAIVIVVIVLIGAGSSALIAFRSGGDSGKSDTGLFTPEPIPTDTTADNPTGGPTEDLSPGQTGGGTDYALTVIGIRSFLDAYRAKFHTTDVVDLTLYGDYAVVNVPRGNNRHAGSLYRNGEWQDFGGVATNFPGAQLMDLGKLDVPALARNIAKAKRTLGVEKPTTVYTVFRYYASADDVPSVDIHVANQFGESGYLATRLDGTIERAYPYGDVQ